MLKHHLLRNMKLALHVVDINGGFHIFFQSEFATVWQSLIKTTVMMIGEFEYVPVFFDDTVYYQVLSYIMFCVFMIIMSIIIMNLLVSLGVVTIIDLMFSSLSLLLCGNL